MTITNKPKSFWLTVLFLAWMIPAMSQHVPVIQFDQLNKRIHQNNDTLYVVNFWATWCGPCVTELPLLESVHKKFANQKVKVLLVSLDFKRDLQTKVIPFVQKRKLRSSVYLLNETDHNTWIDKISPEWSGSIPATLFIKTSRNVRKFMEKEVKAGELETIIQSFHL
ncbi:TlpA disulfide reductase family protein [Cytophagaceae bacterium YF14B1]|uniref:TlpA disulfide reductase family protein n=1 Tax=Xanthocytophaga flava TaxID=3048013 RepID=A0AAE3QRU4_9BACT|nr:TlpA disulfide reductase family protein [Xanthocytophaga flavus]MDJ1469377.1 TlpA disulfide reductase family protein [Xanthocytophaga flavus]MDJ1483771.1 TlpA disulfide reductase family protein [Xanthocytophaga flavus]